MSIRTKIIKLRQAISNIANTRPHSPEDEERLQLILGGVHFNHRSAKIDLKSLKEAEFKIFSQWGDDGIIQWLINNIKFKSHTFIEFGVENYNESNTRFLLMNDNWSGLVIDGSERHVKFIKGSYYFWKHDLTAVHSFVTTTNINRLISDWYSDNEPLGILHIDIDGNDYWIWDSISVVDPVLVIVEYNSLFGTRPITVPKDDGFVRGDKHHSHLYYGSSITALDHLASKRGYQFIGSNSAGNNAYFLKRAYLNERIPRLSATEGYVKSKFRESRDEHGKLNHASFLDRELTIRGMPVWNVVTESTEAF